jgi:hypothetical protein
MYYINAIYQHTYIFNNALHAFKSALGKALVAPSCKDLSKEAVNDAAVSLATSMCNISSYSALETLPVTARASHRVQNNSRPRTMLVARTGCGLTSSHDGTTRWLGGSLSETLSGTGGVHVQCLPLC